MEEIFRRLTSAGSPHIVTNQNRIRSREPRRYLTNLNYQGITVLNVALNVLNVSLTYDSIIRDEPYTLQKSNRAEETHLIVSDDIPVS